jgi:penicillin-binding protein 1A
VRQVRKRVRYRPGIMLVKLALVLLVWLPVVACLSAAVLLRAYANSVPERPDLETLWQMPSARVVTSQGAYVGGRPFHRHVPYEELPPTLIACFLAAEDEDFFEHHGVSLRAIVRAGLANIQEKKIAQGASTISQQLSKPFLSRDKTLRRKFREVLLARRLEATYSKHQLLAAYLRTAFFGHGAHGVTEASWKYFGVPPADLDLSQMATLAALLPAPTLYNPITDRAKARKNRDRLLRRLHTLGMVDEMTVKDEIEKPIEVWTGADRSRAPWTMRRVRREVGRHLADGQIGLPRGWHAIVPDDIAYQSHARRSLSQAISALDRRHGFRGPVATVKEDQLSAVDSLLSAQRPGRFRLARTRPGRADLTLAVGPGGKRSVDWRLWGRASEDTERIEGEADLASDAPIPAETLIFIDATEKKKTWQPIQVPLFEGALITLDSRTGAIRASVGGTSPWTSQFDRVWQACRQPGSAFKPILYSEALHRGFTTATMLNDIPTEITTSDGKTWVPRNADRSFRGAIPLAQALAWSRNIPAIALMRKLDKGNVIERARRMGIESVLDRTPSVALGASCLKPFELAKAYTAFQHRGDLRDVISLTSLTPASGEPLAKPAIFEDPDLSSTDRLTLIARRRQPHKRALSHGVAFMMRDLLRRVVTSGTASSLPDDWLVAGKTGTTEAQDAWFVGFDGRVTTVVWVGSDNHTHELGVKEHGATVALPAFASAHEPIAIHLKENSNPWRAQAPSNIVYTAVDARTGLRSSSGSNTIWLPFVVGTEPRRTAPTKGTRQAESIDELMDDF